MTPCPCSYCKEWRAKIEARIAELEDYMDKHYTENDTLHPIARIDELRKFLE